MPLHVAHRPTRQQVRRKVIDAGQEAGHSARTAMPEPA
ncbi:Protein of unknown function [Propionibacterium freudenreichii subsp. freudenreichii]|uniref:Uncharacterized protein n=1 Tax=Propionibacterium freudenreichii subsp. freudenreichii TaxID=66712 RepID=A0A0B7NYX5_PROFF|nr:Protein of unknown function [Propionibacterium freudenreichii]CEH01218.1 Protein of unknown function [Propionibacterium freudenreichii]CEH04666.1 Protein of unknown function [Propionibacterium freudenreichii]CEI46232.1 Protein of unknown function [Propionibacterium freudenreichii]CEP25898.1 Protein of unknown function [Propionibacterium freudenreichii subsp. freudenreichii]